MAAKQSMTGYTNPFSVTLKDKSSSSLKDGFTVSVSSLSEGQLSVFWGPSIDTVHEILQWSAQTVLDTLTTGHLLQGNEECLWAEQDIKLYKDESKDFHFDCPETVDERSLGYFPRQRYPCMLVASVLNSDENENEMLAVIANFTMVHLQDSIVSLESHVVGQFLKLSDNRVFNLQPVFLATDNDISSRGSSDGQSKTAVLESAPVSIQESNATCSTANNSSTRPSDDPCVCCENCDCSSIRSCDGEQRRSEVCDTIGSESCINTTCDKNTVKSDLPSNSNNLEVANDSNSERHEDPRRSYTADEGNTADEVAGTINCTDGIVHRLANTREPLHTEMASEMVDSPNSPIRCSEISASASLKSQDSCVSEKDFTSGQHSEGDFESEGPECVVCQMNSISHVILPCRHACVCGLCFKKVDRCPMCRGYIDTYFTLFDDGDGESTGNESEQTEEEERGFVAWFTRLNDRLNEYLGLT